jgi:3,4-dihydroxy 2-butanone 4-phosphate synthase/GTP cyclohydrolase II|tara:strand:- start:12357 stop:13592 length:1236 start_codon:yes stop_codon:yes gene_type:complete
MTTKKQFSTIPEIISAIHLGEMVIVVDDEDRENEGDFVMPADTVTPEAINFMTKYGRGLICTPITKERAVELQLEEMAHQNTSLHGTQFTVSVDAVNNTSTGISAFDRYETIKALNNPDSKPVDLARPGHIFPIVGCPEGVLERAGHTEAAIDLARLAGFQTTSVLCEIIDNDGRMAKRDRLLEIAAEHNLKIMTIADLITYRRQTEKMIECTAVSDFPNRFGNFKLHLYRHIQTDENHIALVKGNITEKTKPLVRVHSECLTGDALMSIRCDCGEQLQTALSIIGKANSGILLYLRQEGRGIGLKHKIKAYEFQDLGMDTVEANEKLGFLPDLRDYGTGAQILYDLGVREMKLLTNNPRKIVALDGFGLKIVERVPLEVKPKKSNRRYLETKRDKLGHLILQEDKNGKNG